MHIIAPVSAGTDIVVCVANSIQTMPASAAGSGGDDHERIGPRLEVHHDQQVDSAPLRRAVPSNMPVNALFMVCTWPSSAVVVPRGSVFA